MKLAVVSQKRLNNIIKLADAIEEGEPFDCPHEALIQKIQSALKEGK